MRERRWQVVAENFAILNSDRFSYWTFATRGTAEKMRNEINDRARRNKERVRASLIDRYKIKS